MWLNSKLIMLSSIYTTLLASPTKKCKFPKKKDLVPVYEDGVNAGWAMSPDEACIPGKYCPYACPPGQLMNQWNPDATTYLYPTSMDGGFTATVMALLVNHLVIESSVLTVRELSRLLTKPVRMLHFVKLSYQETKPC